jgi:hypothetical protein
VETAEASWSLQPDIINGFSDNGAKTKGPQGTPLDCKQTADMDSSSSSAAAVQSGVARMKTKSPSGGSSLPSVSSASPRANGGAPQVEVVDGLGQGGYATVVKVRSSLQALGGGVSEGASGGVGTCSGTSNSAAPVSFFAMKVVSKHKHRRAKAQKRLATELKVMRDTKPSRFLERCHAAFESSSDIFFVCDYIEGKGLAAWVGGWTCILLR